MEFESLVRYKALSQRYHSSNPQFLDHVLNDGGENAEKLGLKKVQFMVSPSLHEDLKSVCGYLEMSQREFLESLLCDALAKAWEIVREENADPEALGYTTEAVKC
jgi:hypothetical protein